jgi:hypothetical protein
MVNDLLDSAGTNTRLYGAVFRISEVFSACCDPEELATTLADKLVELVSFDHLDVVVFKENSNEIEWQAWGKGPLPRSDFRLEESGAACSCVQQEPPRLPHSGSGRRM